MSVDLIGLNSVTRWSREVIKLETSNYVFKIIKKRVCSGNFQPETL